MARRRNLHQVGLTLRLGRSILARMGRHFLGAFASVVGFRLELTVGVSKSLLHPVVITTFCHRLLHP